MDRKGFIGSLFDFSFSSFVTPKVIGIVYGIGIFLTTLGIFGIIIGGFSQGFFKGLFSLILSPLIGLVWLLFIRIVLEGLIAGIKTADNTSKMTEYIKQIRDK